jgi:hypothetical protein
MTIEIFDVKQAIAIAKREKKRCISRYFWITLIYYLFRSFASGRTNVRSVHTVYVGP